MNVFLSMASLRVLKHFNIWLLDTCLTRCFLETKWWDQDLNELSLGGDIKEDLERAASVRLKGFFNFQLSKVSEVV